MDPITVIVISTIFCALIVSVFMVAYRYNSMTKEIKAVGNLLRKQAKTQSAINAKVLESFDKHEEEPLPAPSPISAAIAATNKIGSPADQQRITEMLREIIDRLDDIDVILAENFTTLSPGKRMTIPPMKTSNPSEAFVVETVSDISPVLVDSEMEEPDDDMHGEEPEPVESVEELPEELEQPEEAPREIQDVAEELAPLPPFLQMEHETHVGEDAVSGLAEGAVERSGKHPLDDKTAVRCPACSRQLPYDALKIQDEQTCPYCHEVFRSNTYLLSLINEGQSQRKNKPGENGV